MSPNCAVDRHQTLFLFVPGFQKQVFKYVPKCNWIPHTKFLWTPRTKNRNLVFVGLLVLMQSAQRAKFLRNARNPVSANVCGFLKIERVPLTVCEIRLQFAESVYNLQIPLTSCGFHVQLRIRRQLKFKKQNYYYMFMDFTNCSGLRNFCCELSVFGAN